jgi:kinetochore protein Nuf2
VYPFPILTADDIQVCMNDLELDGTTVEKILKPKPAFAKTVYECLAEYCMSVTREQMNQADFASLGAMELVQNPELHEQSIPTVTYFRHMQRLMLASQIPDFSYLEDVIRPNPQRFIRNVSAIINFAKFREERLETHNTMTARTAELVEEKEHQLVEQDLLKQQIEEARAVYSKEQTTIVAAKERNMELKNQIEQKKQAYESEKTDLRDMKDTLSKLKAEDQAVQFQLLNVEEENEKYTTQVVNSPERIRAELRQMEEDLRRLVSSNVHDESTKHAKEHRLTEIEKAMKIMTKVSGMMEGAISDMTAYKDVKKEMTTTKESIEQMNDEVRELDSMKIMKEREVLQAKDKLVKITKTRKLKLELSQQALDQAQKEYDTMLKSRNEATDDENRVRTEIDDIRRQRNKVAADYIAERDNVVNTYNDLQTSVNQYHDRLFGVALTNTNSTTPHGKKRQSLSDSLFGDDSYFNGSMMTGENTPGLPYSHRSMGMTVPPSE